MIARRIFTAILFILFFLILEWNRNSVLGWALLIAVTVLFVILWEKGIFRKHWTFMTGSWILFAAAFAGILFLTWPKVQRVPAVTYRNPVRTAPVEVTGGRVNGVLNEEGTVEIYAGIPYAAPPVGDRRWKEPEDPEPWDGVLEADAFGPMSMQPTNLPIYDSLREIIGYHDYKWFDLTNNYLPAVSEDSLYLNVWKPAGEAKDLPVLVYVHGGSLQSGQPWYGDYSGEGLAKKGIIVVNFAYRLGVYGYLALPELIEESPNHTTGNYGLLDQVKALEWVRDNIAAFGGDPGNVTLSGESAGAAAVSALAASPLTKGLFRRTVLESSTVASKEPPHSFRTLAKALAAGELVKEKYGVSTLAELRALSPEAILASTETEHHMTVDGYALTKTPYEAYLAGETHEEAVFHGYNAEESAPFLIFGQASLKDYETRIRRYFGEETENVLAAYPAKTDEEAKELWAEIYGAVFFDYPHYCLNRLAAANGIPTYTYYFSKKNGRLSAWHSGEEIYLYGNLPEKSLLFDERDYALSDRMTAYLVNFVRTGDPNGKNVPEWPLNGDSDTLIRFDAEISDFRESDRKKALFGILDRMQGFGN